LYIQTRQQKRALGLTGHPSTTRIVAFIGVFWSVGMIFWGINLPSSWSIAVALVVVAIDVILFVTLRRLPKRPASDTTTLERLQLTVSHLIGGSLGVALALIVPLAPINSSWASFSAIMTRANRVLASFEPNQRYAPNFTMADLVRDAYLTQGRLALIMIVGGVAAVGLLTLAINGIIAIIKGTAKLNQSV
jgi:hypothetical protein